MYCFYIISICISQLLSQVKSALKIHSILLLFVLYNIKKKRKIKIVKGEQKRRIYFFLVIYSVILVQMLFNKMKYWCVLSLIYFGSNIYMISLFIVVIFLASCIINSNNSSLAKEETEGGEFNDVRSL